jgi:hypothetical protein
MCKIAEDYFNMEDVVRAIIMERRGPSLDVLVNGERVTLATKWWWSRTEIGRSDEELGEISTSDGLGGAVIDTECDEEGKDTLSFDSSSEASENSMWEYARF